MRSLRAFQYWVSPAAMVVVFSLLVGQPTNAQVGEQAPDPVSMLLISSDLSDATRWMTMYDLDEDGFLDKHELERVPWSENAKHCDLDKDTKLTHLEIALYQATVRHAAGITGLDVNSAKTKLRRFDKNQNGQIDPDETKQGWSTGTADYDRNGDGTITMSELSLHFAFYRGLRRELGVEGVDHSGAGRLIECFDANRNGKLDADESSKTYLPREPSAFDENSDGELTIIELETMLARHRSDLGLTRTDQQAVNGVFRRFDSNGDGRVADQEMEQLFGGSDKEQLAQFDADNDAVVTVPEVEKFYADERRKKGHTEEDYSKAFAQFRRHDLNRSKLIEQDELFETPVTGQLSTMLMGQADVNADNKLSIIELAKHLAIQRKAKQAAANKK